MSEARSKEETLTEDTSSRRLVAVLLGAVLVVLSIHPVFAEGEKISATSGLSPYWEPAVARWSHLIVRYAGIRGLDPDFVASVIWKESKGDSTVLGPTGAVGLMCVKPFSWRPSADELEKPWTNMAAGTRTLAHVIRDAHGDVYYALAAYNGGWDQIHLGVTRRYAADVLDNYVRAVAVEHGLSPDGDWRAILSVQGLPKHTTVIALGPNRPLSRYTEKPWCRAQIPSVPEGRSPHATLINYEGDHGRDVRVNVWVVEEDRASDLVSEAKPIRVSYSQLLERSAGSLLD